MRVPPSRVLHGSALLAELDADLLAVVPVEDRPLARRLRVPTIKVARGIWEPPCSARGGLLGLLVTGGMALHSICADGFTTADAIGAGDVVPAGVRPPEVPGGAAADVSWQVLEPLTAAVLDVRFATCTARWPAVTWDCSNGASSTPTAS